MLHNLRVYLHFLGLHIRGQMQYQVAFWLELLGVGISLGLFFVAIALVLQRFGDIAGWTLGEVALLFGLVEFSFGLMDLLFSGFDPGNFGKNIRLGLLDQLLLRPVSVTVQVLGSAFHLRRLARIFNGLVILAIGFSLTPIAWTPARVLLLPLIVFSMICFFGGLFIIGATITFWTVDSIEIMNIFTYGGSELISYPMSIYPRWLRQFFTFGLPAIFLNYTPTLYLIGKPDPLGLPVWTAFLGPFAGLSVLLVALALWRVGLRHYHSTGT